MSKESDAFDKVPGEVKAGNYDIELKDFSAESDPNRIRLGGRTFDGRIYFHKLVYLNKNQDWFVGKIKGMFGLSRIEELSKIILEGGTCVRIRFAGKCSRDGFMFEDVVERIEKPKIAILPDPAPPAFVPKLKGPILTLITGEKYRALELHKVIKAYVDEHGESLGDHFLTPSHGEGYMPHLGSFENALKALAARVKRKKKRDDDESNS